MSTHMFVLAQADLAKRAFVLHFGLSSNLSCGTSSQTQPHLLGGVRADTDGATLDELSIEIAAKGNSTVWSPHNDGTVTITMVGNATVCWQHWITTA